VEGHGLMDKETHIPKKILVNGKEKTVYARTDQTERELDHYRMGFFAGVSSLPLNLFGDKLKEKQLIITAPYETAKRVIRSRMELDRRPHKVFTGTTLLQYYFINNDDTYRSGFPVFKQFYLLFGYSESTNRRMHELIVETLFTRHYAENHSWIIIPRTLEAMAAQWGDSLMNLKIFPTLVFDGEESEPSLGPISMANPTTTSAVGKPVMGQIIRDPSYKEDDEFAAPSLIPDDPEEERRRRRDYEKLKRKLYE
jgi:hypothetical protein